MSRLAGYAQRIRLKRPRLQWGMASAVFGVAGHHPSIMGFEMTSCFNSFLGSSIPTSDLSQGDAPARHAGSNTSAYGPLDSSQLRATIRSGLPVM
jgi:hypothetical protein